MQNVATEATLDPLSLKPIESRAATTTQQSTDSTESCQHVGYLLFLLLHLAKPNIFQILPTKRSASGGHAINLNNLSAMIQAKKPRAMYMAFKEL